MRVFFFTEAVSDGLTDEGGAEVELARIWLFAQVEPSVKLTGFAHYHKNAWNSAHSRIIFFRVRAVPSHGARLYRHQLSGDVLVARRPGLDDALVDRLIAFFAMDDAQQGILYRPRDATVPVTVAL